MCPLSLLGGAHNTRPLLPCSCIARPASASTAPGHCRSPGPLPPFSSTWHSPPPDRNPLLLFLSALSPAPAPFPFSPIRRHWSRNPKSSATALLNLGPQIAPPSLSLYCAVGPLHQPQPPSGTPGSADSPSRYLLGPLTIDSRPRRASIILPLSGRSAVLHSCLCHRPPRHRAHARCGDRLGARPPHQRHGPCRPLQPRAGPNRPAGLFHEPSVLRHLIGAA
jgi:hypothetical protein